MSRGVRYIEICGMRMLMMTHHILSSPRNGMMHYEQAARRHQAARPNNLLLMSNYCISYSGHFSQLLTHLFHQVLMVFSAVRVVDMIPV